MVLTSATTPGLTSLCSAFEALSERIIRQLTSRASWAAISRAPSPDTIEQDYLVPQLDNIATRFRPSQDGRAHDYMQGGVDTTFQPYFDRGSTHTYPVTLDASYPNPGGFEINRSPQQSEQVNVSSFLADLGFGTEGSQATFDQLFMDSFPEFPTGDWNLR